MRSPGGSGLLRIKLTVQESRTESDDEVLRRLRNKEASTDHQKMKSGGLNKRARCCQMQNDTCDSRRLPSASDSFGLLTPEEESAQVLGQRKGHRHPRRRLITAPPNKAAVRAEADGQLGYAALLLCFTSEGR